MRRIILLADLENLRRLGLNHSRCREVGNISALAIVRVNLNERIRPELAVVIGSPYRFRNVVRTGRSKARRELFVVLNKLFAKGKDIVHQPITSKDKRRVSLI